MNLAVSLFLCVVVAVPAYLWASSTRNDRPAPAVADASSAQAEEVAPLERRLTELERAQAELVERARELETTPAAPAPQFRAAGEEEIAAALERWTRENGPIPSRASGAPAAEAPSSRRPSRFDGVPMKDILPQLLGSSLSREERELMYQELRDIGRIGEYVAAVKELVANDPKNPDLQVELGIAYLQQLFGADMGPEMGNLAMDADACFARALELDDNNWEARFMKAIALSNWPAFLGRGPEAIDHLEILIEQQEGQTPQEHHALPYLFLGNIYQQNGDMEKALATWREGLELFPDFEELKRQVELAER